MLTTFQENLICSQKLRVSIPVSSMNLVVDLSFRRWPVSTASKADDVPASNEAI